MEKSVASEELVAELRRVLHYLYNPAELRKSPLLDILVPRHNNRLSALRQLLADAIQALKPSTQVPPHSNAWRIYHTLVWRYLEQWSQDDVAANLAIGSRQLRRIEWLAVKVLADYLWVRYDLERLREQMAVSLRPEDAPADLALATSSHEQELEWLGKSSPSELLQPTEVIEGCLQTIGPLLQQLGVRVIRNLLGDFPATTGQLLPTRQALLNVLSAAARSVPGGQLEVALETGPEGLSVHVRASADGPLFLYPNSEATESLGMARQLLVLLGGRLDVAHNEEEQTLTVTAVLSAAEQIPVLVVDDNADTLQLFKRYLSGSRYAFIGTTNPEEMLDLAQELAPQIILLDVMVPGLDGWQLLSRLREHPQIGEVPVLVCTILPLEQLALTLGATGFIRKPVSREALLSALDRHVGQPMTGSC